MNSGLGLRAVGATVILLLSVGLVYHLAQFAGNAGKPRDHGLVSSLAIVSEQPVPGFVGDIHIMNIDPEHRAVDREVLDPLRISFEAFGGATNGVDESAVGDGQFSVVLGGDLAGKLVACDSDTDAVSFEVIRSLQYDDLSTIERYAIIQNIVEQLRGHRKEHMGEPVDGVVEGMTKAATNVEEAAIEIAEAAEQYVRIRFIKLSQGTRKIVIERGGAESGRVPEEFMGYRGLVSCDFEEGAMYTEQTWGKRFEIPPVTVSAMMDSASVHVEARRFALRWRQLNEYRLSSATGMDRPSSYDELADGLYASRHDKTASESIDIDSEGRVLSKSNRELASTSQTRVAGASVGQATVSFERLRFGDERDLAILSAGVLLSVAGAMMIELLKMGKKRFRALRWSLSRGRDQV